LPEETILLLHYSSWTLCEYNHTVQTVGSGFVHWTNAIMLKLLFSVPLYEHILVYLPIYLSIGIWVISNLAIMVKSIFLHVFWWIHALISVEVYSGIQFQATGKVDDWLQ
jgi:hypothetical protein